MSLARAHFQRVTAAQAAAASSPGDTIQGTAYELTLAQLAEDLRHLKGLQSIERRIEAKRAMLPAYAPWVDGVLKAGKGGQDAVLMTVMVWRIDTDDFDGALDIAEYALAHDLVLPDQFQRKVPTLIAEEIADKALQALSAGEQAPFEALLRVNDMTAHMDMPDEVRAKLMKACGLEFERRAVEAAGGDDEARTLAPNYASVALDFLRRALQLHDKVGVKKDIERLERFLKNNPPQQPNAAEAGASAGQNTPGQAGAPPAAT